MSNIILPDDPNWKDPLIMKNAYEESATPKMAQVKRGAEFDKQRKIAMDKWGTEGSYPPVPYPNSAIAQAPDAWTKTAQMTGVSNLMTNPMWFSPLHTPQNWQIASKRREIYQWARFFYENEPKVGGAIDFYCFAPETQVLMADGSQKSISSIQPGDMVRSHDGSANQVNKVFVRQTKEDMLRIGISGISLGKALQVTKGHKMLTKRDGKIDYVQAQELKQGDYLLTPIDYSDAINDKSVDVDFSWLLGLYAAEGCGIPYDHVDQNRQRNSYYKGIYITIGYHENELAKKITDIIHRLYGNNKVQINKDEESGIIRISAYGRSIADDLIGLCPGMSKDGSKRFAPIVMKFGQENLMYLLAGFLDGDGCFNKNNGFQGVGVSKKLSEQIANMCDRLGLEYSFTATRISNSNRQVCYNVRLSRRACKPLIDLTQKILDNCVDESKIRNTPYFKEGNYIYRKIRSIRTVSYEGIVYDLEVDNVHSYVVNRIAVSNSRFPMNGFKLECSSRKVLKYFEHQVVKRLKLNEQFKMISSEYFMLGDVFIHMEVDCPVCHSSAVNPDTGEMCNHPGGSFRRMIVINPDWIEVQQSILADEPSIVMVPDEELKRIVFYKQPKNIYDRIPDRIKELVLSNRPIPLSNRVVSHIRHMPVPYGTYGTSLIRRLFTTLAYKTKIMTANWIVAERLILPVRVVKIGSDNRPATSADIADIQQQLGATANDPNLTIVTHHNFEYEWYGAAGKILQVTQEMEHVGKEILDGFMLNQSLLNGEMCYCEDTEVLTKNGFKPYLEAKNDDILTYNLDEDILEYQTPTAFHEYDYDGEMIVFNGEQIDIKVTPHHKMLVYTNMEWKTKLASKVKPYMRFLAHAKYRHKDNHVKSELDINGIKIDIQSFFSYAGYYLSEGSISSKKSNYQVSIAQSEKSLVLDKMKSCLDGLGLKYSDYNYKDRSDIHSLTICNKKFVEFIKAELGTHADIKSIPQWMKNAPVKYLSLLLDALIDGDGQTVEHINTTNYVYTTISEQLADDVQEIAFKIGYNVRKVVHIDSSKSDNSSSRHLFRVKLSRGKWSKGNEPRIKEQHIKREHYEGKVWCFTVPNGFFVTRRNGKITIQGNSGYQCHDVEKTEVLTQDGFKKYDDIDSNDNIATFNKDTEQMEYHHYIDRYDYKYTGNMVHFDSKRIDIMVTPNHRMLNKRSHKKDWEIVLAEDVPSCSQFRSVVNWKGRNNFPQTIKIDDDHVLSLEDYIKVVCYFATEGSVRKETRKERSTFGEPSTTTIYQSEKGKAFSDIKALAESVSYRVRHYVKYDMFCIHNKKLSQHLINVCGNHSICKRIPAWIKELPKKYLRLALDCLIAGDGYFSHPVKNGKQYGMEVKSKQLAEDLYEIAFKCGYSPLLKLRTDRDLWCVDFSDAERGKFPYIEKKYIKTEPFNGRVFCFTVPNGFFITRRNGKITIQGNSAQVGVETLIRRIESWRHTLADWCEENIFKPVAEMQGFIDEELSDEVGEACFLYPKIKWNDLNLKDQTQWHQTLMQLHDKAVISTQTLMEELDLNYDQEIKRMRYEQTQVGPMGGGLGQGAAGGGMGLGDMGGGAGGMGAGMEPMAPGGDMGMGAPGGDMDMGGAGGAPPPAMAAGGKVLKKGKGKEQQQELENVQMPMIKLTSIEQEMAQMLEGLGTKLGWSPQQIQERIRLQFPVENPTGGRQYALDFAFPHFKIGIESDGEIWHNQPEQIEEDKERDQLLAQRGWTILRFDDKTIGEAPQAVLSTIETYVKKAMKGSTKKASTSNGIICLFAIRKGKVTNLEGNYDEYSKQLYISESIEPEDKLSKVNYKNPPK